MRLGANVDRAPEVLRRVRIVFSPCHGGGHDQRGPHLASNLYTYVLNRPADYVDVSGEDLFLDIVKKLAGAARAPAMMWGSVMGSTAIKEPLKIVEPCVRAEIKRQEKRLEMEAAMRAVNAYRAGT